MRLLNSLYLVINVAVRTGNELMKDEHSLRTVPLDHEMNLLWQKFHSIFSVYF